MENRKIPVNNKIFFLTYSQCDLGLEGLLERIKRAFCLLKRKITKYVIANEEHKDGGKHRHCYIELDATLRAAVSARFLDMDSHHPNIEFVRSWKKVLKYCTKEKDFITNMDVKSELEAKPVSKKDLGALLLSGVKLAELVQVHPQLIFGYQRTQQDLWTFEQEGVDAKPLADVCGIWLCGPAGTGKSRETDEKWPESFKKDNSKWWDGYSGQPVVVLDDWDITWKEHTSMLKWAADYKPFPIQQKGIICKKPIRPKYLVVTSNLTLEEYLEAIKWPTNDYTPYTRRFKVCWGTCREDFKEFLKQFES